MTRVLCLTSWYPPHHFGGYELSCQDVMTRLADRGHHVEVLTSDHRHDDRKAVDTATVAAVHRRLRLYFRDGTLWSPSPAGRLRVERHNQRALREALESCRPEVVAVWHVGAMSLSLLTALVRSEVPLVYAVSDDWPAYARQLDPWTRALRRVPGLTRAVELVTRVPSTIADLDASGAFCFISEVTRERCRRSSPWSFPVSTIVYSGIDGQLFGGAARTTTALELTDHRSLMLLYVGRVDERKGIRTLVKALADLPEATLVIDGHADDSDRASVLDWARAAGVSDRVSMQRSDRPGLPEVYRAADICVFPSEWEEPFGLVPLEAMACGTPVVATGVGGSGEFLFDEANCVLFEAGDHRSLAAAVRRLREDPELRGRVITNGFTSAEHFDSDHLADVFEAWYKAAAAGELAASTPPSRAPLQLDGHAGSPR